MLLPFRKPLVCVGPKVLIRLPESVSALSEMGENTQFQSVLNDPNVSKKLFIYLTREKDLIYFNLNCSLFSRLLPKIQ